MHRIATPIILAVLPCLAGCLGTAPEPPKCWNVEGGGAAYAGEAPAEPAPAVKLMQLDVRAPYNGTRFAVLRSDGSVAFDSCNSFAAPPAALLKGAAYDLISSSGKFGRVVNASSSAGAPFSMEITVTRLALDCRSEGRRDASAAVALTLVRGRNDVSFSVGEASMPAADGNYTAAFSGAFAGAMSAALHRLSVR